MVDGGPHQEVRETLNRAIWRLNILEYVLLFAVAILSLFGGALLALLLGSLIGTSFRLTWAVASILIFVIPAVVIWNRELRPRQAEGSGSKTEPQPRERNG